MKHLVIVDGHHLLYRAYWAIPRTMKTSSGEQVNTAFGVASMLINILKQEEPDSLLFCFDADEDTFRHKEYAEYKAGRSATPPDFYPQVPRTLGMIDSFGIKSVSGNAYEADDYACAYAKVAAAKGYRVTIVSGDRDLLQLATEHVRIVIPHKGYQAVEYLGPKEIEAKYGVRPDQIVDYKGLTGDSSDNLPGVPGIGPKTASTLLQKYGTLSAIYENLAEIKDGWRAKLEAGKEKAFFCQRMAQLVCDIPMPVALEDLELKDINVDPIIAAFHEFEFSLVVRRFRDLVTSSYGQGHFKGTVSEGALTEGKKGVVKKKEKPEVDTSQLSLL